MLQQYSVNSVALLIGNRSRIFKSNAALRCDSALLSALI